MFWPDAYLWGCSRAPKRGRIPWQHRYVTQIMDGAHRHRSCHRSNGQHGSESHPYRTTAGGHNHDRDNNCRDTEHNRSYDHSICRPGRKIATFRPVPCQVPYPRCRHCWGKCKPGPAGSDGQRGHDDWRAERAGNRPRGDMPKANHGNHDHNTWVGVTNRSIKLHPYEKHGPGQTQNFQPKNRIQSAQEHCQPRSNGSGMKNRPAAKPAHLPCSRAGTQRTKPQEHATETCRRANPVTVPESAGHVELGHVE